MVPRTKLKCAAGARRRNSISRPGRIGKWAKRAGFLICGGRKNSRCAIRDLSRPGATARARTGHFFLDTHARERLYGNPSAVSREHGFSHGRGQFPKFAADMFQLEGTDFWLTPTAEVELTNLYRDETLDEDQLPIKDAPGRPVSVPKRALPARTREALCASINSKRWRCSNSRARKELRRTRIAGGQR